MKICSCCKVEKPLEEFYARTESNRIGKREAHCRICKKESSKKPYLVLRRKERQKRYRKNNFQKERARADAWNDKNRERLNKNQRENLKRRRASDPAFRMRLNISSRISHLLQGRRKSLPTLKLVGCSLEQLRQHIEKQFQPGMTWENYGTAWHVDHKRPCADFSNLLDIAQQKECFHFLNFQPLWAEQNLIKNDRLDGFVEPAIHGPS